MTLHQPAAGGLREKKRDETKKRIAVTGLRLFIEHGYDATTLEMIAVESGISRRTFFYYFKTKEDIILASGDGGFASNVGPAMLSQSQDQTPVATAHACFRELAAKSETRQSIVVDRLLRSTSALRLRKEALLLELELEVASAMYKLWPKPELRSSLRMDAMIAMGALRLAIENWRTDEAMRPLAACIDDSFKMLGDHLRKSACHL